jgi:Aspartyl protease/PDZ domain
LTLVLCLALALSAAEPLTDVAFDDDFSLVFLEVTVDGSPPLSFLLDTGFDVSVLDAGTAAKLGLASQQTRVEAQPGGDVETGRLAPVALGVGPLHVPDVPLITVPLAALQRFVGRRVDGILGHDPLERYVVDIDYPRRRLRLLDPAGFTHTGTGQVLPMRIDEAQIFVDAGVVMPWGRTVFGSFKIDTGSLDAAGLNLNFVRDGGLIGPDTREVAAEGVAVGGATEGRLFRAGAVVIGADAIPAPLLGYTVDSKGFENRADAGTLGGAVLSRYRVILDYPRERLILEGGPDAGRPVRENQAGMLVVASGPDWRTLVVAQVVPGSAAAEAGVAAGDEIVSMAGREGFALVDARRLLEEAGPLDVVVRREGRLLSLTLRRRLLLPLR